MTGRKKSTLIYYKMLRNAALTALLMFSFVLGGFYGAYHYMRRDLPSIARLELKDYTTGLVTKVYASDGSVVKEFFEQKRIPITLDQVPKDLVNATLAVEDKSFYSHLGVDFMGILRALWVNLRERRIVQGGSTITQQLARNLFLNPERTFLRKVKEAILALQIESTYSKDEILELYFNQIYYGSGAYGAEAAAQVYFGKHVWELGLVECATLAGIPRWPARYSPKLNPDASLERTKTVLKLMEGMDRRDEEEEITSAPLAEAAREGREEIGSYYTEIVRQYLENKYGYNRLYKGGLRVYTAMDLELQREAEKNLEEGLKRIEEIPGYRHPLYENVIAKRDGGKKSGVNTEYLQGSLTAIDPNTGYVKVLVGGRDFHDNEFNRAVFAKRQPGSAFKPIIYTAAIDNGIPPSTIIIDSPISVPQVDGTVWRPTNYEQTFAGPMILRVALAHSINMVAIKLIMKIGPQTAAVYAKKMGITSELPLYESLALGTGEITPLEGTVAFATFPSGGIRSTPIFVTKVLDAKGNVLEENRPVREQVISPQTAYVMTSLMEDVLDYGTGSSARAWGFTRPAGGKTGTNTDYSDAWFIGFTPDLVCCVWVGFDEVRTIIGQGTGSKLALPIWSRFMKFAHENLPERTFPIPDGVATHRICKSSGLLATEYCPREETYYEVFVSGTEPAIPCEIHSPRLLRADDEYNIDRPRERTRKREIF